MSKDINIIDELDQYSSEEKGIILKILKEDNKALESFAIRYRNYPGRNDERCAFLSLYLLKKEGYDSKSKEYKDYNYFYTDRLDCVKAKYSARYYYSNAHESYKKRKYVNFLMWLYDKTKNIKLKEKLLLKATEYSYIDVLEKAALFYSLEKNDKENAKKYYIQAAHLGSIYSIKKMLDYYRSKLDKEKEEEILRCGVDKSDEYMNEYIEFALKEQKREYIQNAMAMIFSKIKYNNNYYMFEYLAKLYEEGIYVTKDIFIAYLLYSLADTDSSKEKANFLKEKMISLCSEILTKEEEEKKQKEEEKNYYDNLIPNLYSNLLKTPKKDLVLDLNPDDIFTALETKKDYNKKVSLYKHALKLSKKNSKLQATIEASKAGHTKAMIALYHFYKDDEIVEAYNYLLKAIRLGSLEADKILKEESEYTKGINTLIIEKEKEDSIELRKRILALNDKDLDYIILRSKIVDSDAFILLEKCFKYQETPERITEKFEEKIKENASIKYIYYSRFILKDIVKYTKALIELYRTDLRDKAYKDTKDNAKYIIQSKEAINLLKEESKRNNANFIKRIILEAESNPLTTEYVIDSDNKKESLDYLFAICENKNKNAIIKIIDHYIKNNKKADEKYINAVLSFEELEQYGSFNAAINFAIAKLYKEKYISKTKTKVLTPKDAFYMFEKAKEQNEYSLIKKEALLELINCYINGYGVDKDLLKASKLYEKIDKKKAKELLDKSNQEEYLKKLEVKTRNLFAKYPCKEYDELCKNDKSYAELIFNKCKIWDDASIEKNLRRRDYLLSIGLSIYEIYGKSGMIIEQDIKDLVTSKENEIKRKKEEEERIRLEKIRQEQLVKQKEKINEALNQTIQKPQENKSNDVKTSSNTVSPNLTQPAKPKIQFKIDRTPISDDNPYFKELYTEHKGWTFYDEAKAVARLRQRLNYPLSPHMAPEYDSWGNHHSKREREKQYIKDLETHKDKIREYKSRLYSEENPLKMDYDAYREKVWGISPGPNVLVCSKFAEKCEKVYNSQDSYSNRISVEAKSYVFCDREHKSLNNYEYVERMLSFVPNYAKEITLVIKAKVSYEKDYSSSYLDAYDAFENSEYSKMMTWQEFSDSSKSEIGSQIYINNLNDNYKNSGRRIEAENKRKEEITRFIKKMFEEHTVFAGFTFIFEETKKQYIEGKVSSIKFEFKFYE